ncbi:MAG: hypothetical protein QM472_01660 [Spirochaetota bacterium]|nr:hypothetical protein [Spirochaetota bacterium]
MKELDYRSMPARGLRIVGRAVLGLATAAFFALIFGLVVMYLWNWLAPAIFGLGRIGFWQAFGLIVLTRILVGGVHQGGRYNGHLHESFRPLYPVPDEARVHRKEYRDFWKQEGYAAFREYLRRREEARKGGEGFDSDG